MPDAPNPRRVTETEARAAYFALGQNRSLNALLDQYRADPTVTPPSDSTLKRWSTKHKWVALALEHDAEVAAKAGKLVAQSQAKEIAALNITPSRVLEEASRIAFSNIADFIEIQSDGTAVVDLNHVKEHPELLAAVQEITVHEYVEGKGDNARDVKSVKIKLHPKLPAIEKLGEWMALWKGSGAPPPEKPSETHIHVNGNLTLVKQVHAELDVIFESTDGATALAAPNPAASG